jgi:1-acyl-sn-glycerol-3-phosphate acyltransferase
VQVAAAVLQAAYRYWWRVAAVGLERVPDTGRVLLVANRGGALLPYESLMLTIALATEHPARRPLRALIDPWIAHHPLLAQVLAGMGALPATGANLRRLLEHDEAVLLFPEGDRAVAKPFRTRYRLARFGRGAFARVAIETGTPIVPVAVIGTEEVHPVLARLDRPGRLLGLPTLPVTPTFPWLGLAGLLPLPTKWTLHVGEPLDVAARHAPAAGTDAEAVRQVREQVRERLQALMLEGLRRRRSIFRG